MSTELTGTPGAASDATASYVDIAKWIVGLSAAVLAGLFLHPEHVAQWPGWAKWFLAGVLFLFGASIISGVLYPFWLSWMRRQREKIEEVEEELTKLVVKPDPARRAKLEDRKKKLKDGLEKEGPRWTNFWHQMFIYFFCSAALLGVVGFCASIVVSQKKPDEPKGAVEIKKQAAVVPLRFAITQSAVHKTKKGMEAHTFLLNQQTGEVWQMVCDGPSGAVSFRRVPWLDLNNRPEKGEVGPK
jgi:hypothetical protein